MQEQTSLEKTETSLSSETLEKLLVDGDLSKLSSDERLLYYRKVCESLGLNPLTKPFGYIVLDGKLTLYALKCATEQLRAIHKISVIEMQTKQIGDVYVVQVTVRNAEGRTDIATGAVSLIKNERGRDGAYTKVKLELNELANYLMRCETKAKRRATLSICGLGWLDESEIDTVPGATISNDYLNEMPKRLSESVTEDVPITEDVPVIKNVFTTENVPVAENVFATENVPTTTTQDKDNQKISQAQAKRLYAIWKSKGKVTKEEMQEYLLQKHSVSRADDLSRSQYDEVCEYAETGVRQ